MAEPLLAQIKRELSDSLATVRRQWWVVLVYGLLAWFSGLLVAIVRSRLRHSFEFPETVARELLIWSPFVDQLVMLLVFWLLAAGWKRKAVAEYLSLRIDHSRSRRRYLLVFILISLETAGIYAAEENAASRTGFQLCVLPRQTAYFQIYEIG